MYFLLQNGSFKTLKEKAMEKRQIFSMNNFVYDKCLLILMEIETNRNCSNDKVILSLEAFCIIWKCLFVCLFTMPNFV